MPQSKPAAQPLPRLFGRYQLFDRIGAGGMAEIYLARAMTELSGAKLVVVKQILPELADNQQFADMLVSEAKLASKLNHPNVVQVFDLGRHDDTLFIAMEYVEGFDLNELLRRCAQSKVPLPIEFSLLIIAEVLRGLSHAHRVVDDQGRPSELVHRDVSPSNVLISFEGEVKVCDFGIARANDMADMTSDDIIRGKAGYMSPEQAKGQPLDARADVFAVGILLWELLAGRKLYKPPKNTDDLSLIDQARRAEIPVLPTRGLPEEPVLFHIVEKALARELHMRFDSADTMLRQLEQYLARAQLVASPLRFGAWLTEHFADNLIEIRRARERGANALMQGPAAVIEPVTPTPAPARTDAAPPMHDGKTVESPVESPAELAATPAVFVASQPDATKVRAKSSPVLMAVAVIGLVAVVVAIVVFAL